jgi:uncharacterized protein YtpQ (UPF0354 family)
VKDNTLKPILVNLNKLTIKALVKDKVNDPIFFTLSHNDGIHATMNINIYLWSILNPKIHVNLQINVTHLSIVDTIQKITTLIRMSFCFIFQNYFYVPDFST